MNWDRIEGNWKQTKGTLQECWGRMTNNYVAMIDGRRTKQLGEIQTSYAIASDQAKRQIRAWKKGNNRLMVVSSESRCMTSEDGRKIESHSGRQMAGR
jgi:uncharacterized protein YjbJ (UPF0337 family)